MKHLFKFESFDGPGEYREVNQDEWNKFYSTNKRLPMDSNDLKKLGSLVDFSRFREGDTYLTIKLNRDTTVIIGKFEDEWWSVYIKLSLNFTMYTKNTHYICDGLDSAIDLIHKLNKNDKQ